MPSSPYRRATLSLVVALAACGDSAAPKRVHTVSIDRIRGTFALGASVQLVARVEADAGADTTVRWSTEPENASPARITPGGRLTACYPGGTTTVVATSVADSTKRDAVLVTVQLGNRGWAFPSGLARPDVTSGPTAFVDPASMNGEVEVTVTVNASAIAAGGCRTVERVELRLTGAARDTAFASIVPTAPFAENRTVRARLRTTAVPNGDYVVSGGVYMSGLAAPEPIVPLRVTVRN